MVGILRTTGVPLSITVAWIPGFHRFLAPFPSIPEAFQAEEFIRWVDLLHRDRRDDGNETCC